MAYTYTEVKTQQAFLKKGFQDYKLINMSINLLPNQVHETYHVILGQTDNFNHLEFVCFDNEDPLTNYLEENPSGLYQNLDGYRRWGVTLARPRFSYRVFTFYRRPYVIVRIKDAGVVYNLLMSKYTYEIPFMFNQEKPTKTNLFNFFDLLNLGLLGRQTSYDMLTDHALIHHQVRDEDSVTRITFENPTNREGMERYHLYLDSSTQLLNLYDYGKVVIEPQNYDITNPNSNPGVKVRLLSEHEDLEIVVQS